MNRHTQCCLTSVVVSCVALLVQHSALAQDSRAAKQTVTTQHGRIWRRGELYDVPPLRIRLLNASTREPRMRTPVQIQFVAEWEPSQSTRSEDNSVNVYRALHRETVSISEAVTDDDGYFIINATTIVPEGFAPPGDDPRFIPRFAYICLGFEVPGGRSSSNIDPATIEAVRAGQLACIEIPPAQESTRPDESPHEVDVMVQPAAGWTSSKMRVKRGDRIQVKATGRISLGRQGTCGPDGIGAVDPDALMPDKPLGALIAVIGDENDDFIYIGTDAEFISPHDGTLFFGVNEGDLTDNSGTISAHVRILK